MVGHVRTHQDETCWAAEARLRFAESSIHCYNRHGVGGIYVAGLDRQEIWQASTVADRIVENSNTW